MLTKLFALIHLLRPKQWVKNTFVLAGVLFGAQLRNVPLLQEAALAFVAFSFMGSSVYVLNDYLDRESDKLHPSKRHRALASGAVTPLEAAGAAIACIGISLVAAALADVRVVAIVLAYLAINCAYSVSL